jgi:diaminohydroxyphosphoribosylaminopyrimidine deaminase / 5-amino-6-(5-phosphoribosylamino)uracil reductase
MTRDAAAVKSIAGQRPAPRTSQQPRPLGDGSRGGDVADDCDALWSLCLEISRLRRQGLPPTALAGDGASGADAAFRLRAGGGGLSWEARQGWQLAGDWSAAARELFDLYRPLLAVKPGERYVLGHLGQSIDGRIATSTGDSCYINGQQNLVHMHRLRALCDAVLVGAATVVADDPQLTTRLVPGPHATRVVIDPSQRLTPAFRVCSDERCPTLVARLPAQPGQGQDGAASPGQASPPPRCGSAEIIAATAGATGVDLGALLDTLADRGLRVILVEGGGITVSRFLEQKLLDRLQIAIAPVIIGSGRQGLQLPEVLVLDDCLRPSCRQRQMGPDILWDLDLRAAAS